MRYREIQQRRMRQAVQAYLWRGPHNIGGRWVNVRTPEEREENLQALITKWREMHDGSRVKHMIPQGWHMV